MFQLKTQMQELQEEANHLHSLRLKLETELKTSSSKLQTTEMELSRLKTEAMNEIQLKTGAFERKLIDKDELISKMSALLILIFLSILALASQNLFFEF